MKILFFGGNHPRHLYYINQINKRYEIAGAVILKRESVMPSPPEGIAERDRLNFVKHFKNRLKAENKYFGEQKYPDCPILEVTDEEFNSQKTVEFSQKIDPDMVLIFGADLIKDPLYSVLPKEKINLHLGLSPRYRGAATLFWPFYFMEPNHAGSTIHYIIDEPDAGKIIHHVVPKLEMDDQIHDVACKVVVQSAEEMIRLLDIYKERGCWEVKKQKSTGKLFLERDFKPEHLRVIYDVFNDNIVKYFLEGKLKCKKRFLFRQF